MKIELRVNNLRNINEFINMNVDSIIVGHEACPHQLWNIEDTLEAFDKIESKGIDVKFQIPLSYQKHFEKTFSLVEKIVNKKKDIELIVNDFGMLYAIKNRGLLESCNPIIGHGISYSYENCPWNEHILELEKEEIHKFLLTHNLDSRDNIDILKSFGVKEIEVDILDGLETSCKNFKNSGFKLNGGLDMVIVSISRACHVARFYDKEDQIGNNCRDICEEPIKISATHRWSLLDNTHSRIRNEVQEIMPQLTVFSNVICLETETDIKSPILKYLDSVTIDSRRYSIEKIKQRIGVIKDFINDGVLES